MAFNRENFNNSSSGGAGSLKVWTYKTTADTVATIMGADYFLDMRFALNTNDMIYIVGSDGAEQLLVSSAVNATSVTTVAFDSVPASSIVNADISATAAIEFSKLEALTSTQILVGSAGNVPTAVAMSGDATMDNTGAVTVTHPDAVNTGTSTGRAGYYHSHVDANGKSTLALTADRIYFIPVVIGTSNTYTRIGVEVTILGALATARIGIYEVGTDGNPGALVLDAGTIDASTTGEKEITIAQVIHGLYYLCVITDVACTVRASSVEGLYRAFGTVSSISATDTIYLYKSTQAAEHTALSDPAVTTLTADTSSSPQIWLRVV